MEDFFIVDRRVAETASEKTAGRWQGGHGPTAYRLPQWSSGTRAERNWRARRARTGRTGPPGQSDLEGEGKRISHNAFGHISAGRSISWGICIWYLAFSIWHWALTAWQRRFIGWAWSGLGLCIPHVLSRVPSALIAIAAIITIIYYHST